MHRDYTRFVWSMCLARAVVHLIIMLQVRLFVELGFSLLEKEEENENGYYT